MTEHEKTILVVEDDPDIRELAVMLLEAVSYRVIAAETADAAYRLLVANPDWHVDLLFTDVVMPGRLDGIDLANAAKKLRPEIKVLYATGFANLVRDKRDAALTGRVLAKPYRPAQLHQEIRALLDEEPC
ncbi:MAG: response regulator [Alphaproteobacteria bacterium]|nr:response regulator [Alphaproteobacteria bacterium]